MKERKKLSLKKIIQKLLINYALFILIFFTLGFVNSISVIRINFLIDVFLIIYSLYFNLMLLKKEYNVHFFVKMLFVFITMFLAIFVYFAFLMPENGLPPVLFM